MPLVFVFHGHGGTGANIERKFDIESLWPDVIVVYPYGLVGHKGKTDPQGVKSGWQTSAGESGDRDLKFYDAMLATLRAQLSVDPNRVYAMGHSNGSGFVSLLLNRRGAGSPRPRTCQGSRRPAARHGPGALDVHGDGHDRPDRSVRQPEAGDPDRGAQARRGSGARDRGRESPLGEGPRQPRAPDLHLPGRPRTARVVPRLVVAFFRRHTLAGG